MTFVPTGGSGTGLPSGGAASQVIGYGGSSGTGSWVFPPGFEIGYAQITVPVTVASTTESAGTSIIAPGALTFDGAPVLVTFFAPYADAGGGTAGNQLVVCLFESTTQIGRIANLTTASTQGAETASLMGMYRFTPTAGAHTYTVTAFLSGSTPTGHIGAGATGTATNVPAFVRFTKV